MKLIILLLGYLILGTFSLGVNGDAGEAKEVSSPSSRAFFSLW
jgi:hypothetical protein